MSVDLFEKVTRSQMAINAYMTKIDQMHYLRYLSLTTISHFCVIKIIRFICSNVRTALWPNLAWPASCYWISDEFSMLLKVISIVRSGIFQNKNRMMMFIPCIAKFWEILENNSIICFYPFWLYLIDIMCSTGATIDTRERMNFQKKFILETLVITTHKK